MEETLLKVEHLKKYFPVKQKKFFEKPKLLKAVDDVSFDIKKGEIVGLVGESGSGKTTIGKCLMNLLEPTGGRVTFGGELLFDIENNKKLTSKALDSIHKNMQMVFQDPYASLDPRMSIELIITEGLKKHSSLSRNELHEKAAELVEECGLDAGCLRKFPHQFSGGQRQRIGVARAISIRPTLVICDEPTAALDVSIQSQVLNLMLDLKKKYGMSYLFITHNMSIVKHFCSKVCVMYLGSLVEIAGGRDLFTSPAHPYTQALLEATPSVREPKREGRELLRGEIPSPIEPPSGCKFHTRCKKAMAICSEMSPEPVEIEEGHFVSCHLFQQKRADL